MWDTTVFGKTVSEERTVSTVLVDPEEEDRPLTSSTDNRCQITRTTHECLFAQDLDKDRVRTAWEGDRRWLDSDPDQREMNHHDDERQDPVSVSAVGEEGILPEDNGGRGPAEHYLSHHCVEMTSFRHDQCKERRGKGFSTYQDTFERSCEANRCLRPALERGDFVAILSHPQGSSKCFSVGPAAEFDQQSHMKQRNTSCLTRTGCDHSAKDPTSVEDVDLINERLEACKNRIYYTQSTFGCSGAPVLLFKKSLQHTKIPVVDYSQHSGTCYFRDGIHLGFSTRFSPPACNSCERTPSELKECYSVLRQQEQILHLQEQTRSLKSEHCPSPAEATHIVHAGIVAITGDRNLEAVVTRRAPSRQHCIDHWESRHTIDSHYVCPKSHLTNASWTSQNSLFTETYRTYDEYDSPQSKDELAINGLSSEDRSTKGMSEISLGARDGFLDFGTEDGCDVSCVDRGCCIEHGSDENHHSPPVFNVDHGVCTLEGHSPDKRYPGKQPRNGRRPPRHRRPETQNPIFRNYATHFNQRRPHLRMHPPSAERRRYEYQNWTDNNQRFRPHVPFFRHANPGHVHSMRTTSKAVPDRQVYDSLGGQSLFEEISVSDTPLQDLLNPEQRNTRQTLTAGQSFVNSYTSLDAHSSLNVSANSVSLCYSPTADNLSEQCLDDSRGMPTVENCTNEDWSDKSTAQGKGEHEDVVYTLANSSPVCTSSASIRTQDINYRFYNIERTEERYEKAAMQSVRPETPEQLICKPGELEEAGTTFQSPRMTPNSQLFPANTPDNEGGSDQVDEARAFQSPEGTSSYQLYLASIPDNKGGLDQQDAGTTFQPPEGTPSYQLFPASIPDKRDGSDQQDQAGTIFQSPVGTPSYQLFPASIPDKRDGSDQQDQTGTIFQSPVGTPSYQLFPADTSYKDGSDQVMEAGTAFQSPERTPNYQLFPTDIPDKDGSDQVEEAGTTFQSPEGTPSYLFFLESISDNSDDQDQEEEAGTTFQSPEGTPSYQLFLESISDNSDDQDQEEEAGTTFRSPEGTPSYQLFLESISDNSDDQDQQETGTTFQPPDGTSSYQLFPGSVPDNKDGSDQMQEWRRQHSYSVPLTEDHVRNLDLSANLPSLFSNRSNDLHTQTSTNALTVFADPMLTNTSTVSDNQLTGTSDATSERVLAHKTQSANSLPTGSECSSQPLDANDSFQTLEKLVESLSTAQETTAVAKSARSSPESDCHPQPAEDKTDLSNCTAPFNILTKPPSRGNVVRPDTEGNVDKQEDSGRKQASVCQAFDLHSEQSLKLENESSNGYETKKIPEMSMESQVSESTEKSGNQQSVSHLRLAPKDTPRRVNREMHSLHHLKVLKHERKQMRRKKRFAPKFPDQKLKTTPTAENEDSTSQEFLSGLHQMEERFLNLSPLRVKDFDGREMQKLGLKRLEQYHMEIERLKLTSRPEDQNENLSCAHQNCPLPPYSKSRREPKLESTDGPHDTDTQSRLPGPGQEIMDPHLKTKAHRTLQNSTVTSGLRIDRPVARESVSANHNAQMHKKVEQRQWPAETWQSGVMKTESQQRMAAAIQQQAFQTPLSANVPASSSRDISSDKKPTSGPSNGNDNNLAHQFTRSPLHIRDNSSTQTITGVPSNSRDTNLVPQLASLVNSRDNSLVQQNIRHPFNIRDNNSVQQLTHNSSHAGIPGSTFPRHIDNRSGQYNATGFATGHQPSAFASQPLGDMPVQEPAGDQTNASHTNFANQYLFQQLYETAKKMFDFHYHQSPRHEIMYPESGVDMRLEPSQVHKGTQYYYRSNSRAENAPFAIKAQGDPPSQVHEGTQYNYRSNSRAENAPFAVQAQGDPPSQVHKGTQYNYRSNSRAENAPFAIQAQGDPPSQVHEGTQYYYRSNSRAENAPFAIQAQGDPHLLRFRQMQAGQRTGFSQDPMINTATFSGAPVHLPHSASFSGQLPQPLNTDPSYYVAERRLECSHLDGSLGSTSILSSSTDSSYSSSSECSDHSLSEAEEMPGSPDQTQPSTSGPNVYDLFGKTSDKDAGTDATNCTSPDLAGKKWKENVLPSSTAKESSQHHEYRLFDVTSVVGVVLEMGVVKQDSDPASTMLPQTSQLHVVQPGVQRLSVSDNELQSNHAQGAGSFDLESIHMVDKFLREACSPSQKQVYRSYKPTAGNVGHSLWKPNHVSGCCQTGNNLLHSEQNFFGMAETNPQLAHGQSRYHTNESSAHVPHFSTKSTCSTSHRPWVLSGNVSEVWNGLSGKHSGDLTQDSPADQNQLRRVYFNTAPTLLSVHGKVIGMTHFTPGTDPNQNMQQSVSAHPYCQQGDIVNTGSLWSQGALCHPSIRPVYHSHPHVCMPPAAFPVHHSVPSGSMCDRVSRHTQPNAHHFRSMSESSQPAYSSPSTDHQLSLQPRSQSSSNNAHEAGAHNLLSSQPRSQSSSNDAHEAETAQSQGPCSDNMDGGVVQTACVATTDSLDTSFLVTLEEMDIVRNISLERQAEDVVDRSAQVIGGSNSRQRLYTKNERAKRTKLRYRTKKWKKAEKLPLEKRYRLRYQQAAENSTSDEEPSENSPLIDPKTEPAFKQDKGQVLDSASTSGTSDREVCYVTVPVDIRVRLEKAAKWITTQMFGCPQVHYLTPSDAHTFRLQQNLHLTMQVMTLKG